MEWHNLSVEFFNNSREFTKEEAENHMKAIKSMSRKRKQLFKL